MMTMMTIEAQMDPTVMVGSNLPAIGGTLRIGGKGCFVAESCEYTNFLPALRADRFGHPERRGGSPRLLQEISTTSSTRSTSLQS
ncbi:MAG: hypothetical protein ACLR4Z_03735 [Butyricicoccaceae bacterium]